MAHDEGLGRRHDRWAHLRFAVVGALLAAPPTKGDLHEALTALAAAHLAASDTRRAGALRALDD